MKRLQQAVMAILFVGVMSAGGAVYATEIAPVQEGMMQYTPVTEEASETTKEEAIEIPETAETEAYTDEDNYVRITQPALEDEMQTFDSQINIMGEAAVGTKIKIIVYYGDEEYVYVTADMDKDEYAVKEVGVTGTFSQLIDLKEGQNSVLIAYEYKDNGEEGVLSFKINRIKESEKEVIKSYMDPQAIVEKMVPTTTDAQPSAAQLPVGKAVSAN